MSLLRRTPQELITVTNRLQATLISASLLLFAGVRVRADDALPVFRSLESSLVEAIAQAEQSVVSLARITRKENAPAADALPTDSGFIPTHFGSGVIIAGEEGAEERYVLTAGHVAFGQRTFVGAADHELLEGTELYVRLPSRHLLTAELVAADHRSDLAVLRLPLAEARIPLEAAPPVEFGEADELRKGSFVIALGNPYAIARDGSASASVGIVSNIARRPWPPRGMLADPTEQNLTIHHYGTLLTVDTRLNLGTSGGALVDLEGKLVGVTTSLAALEGYEKSVGYAVPLDAPARRIIESLRQGYEAEYGFLGIQPGEAGPEVMARYRQLTPQATAARVRFVAPHSPAEQGGLRTGDLVLAVDGTPVYSDIDLVREVGWLGPDAEATLSVLRPGDQRITTIVCRLAKWPVYDDSLLVTTRERHPVWRGLHVDYATARRRYLPANPLGPFPQGVVITAVDPGSPAAQAGLFEGQFIVRVDDVEVSGPAEFAAVTANTAGEVFLHLSDGQTVTLSEAETQ